MKIKKRNLLSFVFLLIGFFAVGVLAQTTDWSYGSSTSSNSGNFNGGSSTASYNSYQSAPTLNSLYGSDATTYWPSLSNRDTCQARTDLLLGIAPGGCTPAVVRSDLLAEQNVPVFCQIESFKINPLIDIDAIQSISFVGDYPPEVSGFGFHPARAALRSREQLLGAPLMNNIGYAVIVLKQQPIESELPDFVNVSLGAKINYRSGNSLGIGRTEFVLQQSSDSNWDSEKTKSSFWNGRYFLRLDEVDSNFATVSIYEGDRKIVTTRVEKGKTSNAVYIPGFYCQAGLQITYAGFVSSDDTARIEVSDSGGADVFEVAIGSSFFDNRCRVVSIDVGNDSASGEAKVSCSGKTFVLKIGSGSNSTSVESITVDGNVYQVTLNNNKYEIDLSSLSDIVKKGKYSLEVDDSMEKLDNATVYTVYNASGDFVFNTSESSYKHWFESLYAGLKSFKSIQESNSQSRIGNDWSYFYSAIDDYEFVVDNYANEKAGGLVDDEAFGESALKRGVDLAQKFGEGDVKSRLIYKLNELYPNNAYGQSKMNELSSTGGLDYSESTQVITIDNLQKVVRLISLSKPAQKASADFRVFDSRYSLTKGIRKQIPETGTSHGEVILEEVTADSVRIGTYCANTQGNISLSKTVYEFKIGEAMKSVCGLDMVLTGTNAKEAAKIQLYPKMEGTATITNFSVNIGIEKRAIELTPDKTKEKIDNLNDTIKKWEDTSEKLGKVVTGLKGACFATSALLTFKNFVSGLSGETVARQEVMNGKNGWTERCKNLISSGKYDTPDQCYFGESANIDAEVEKVTTAINKVNSNIDTVQKKFIKEDGLFGSSVDSDKVKAKLIEKIKTDHSGKVNLTGMKGVWNENGTTVGEISIAQLLADPKTISTESLRKIMLYKELEKSGNLGPEQAEAVQSKLLDVVSNVNNNRIAQADITAAKALERAGYPSLATYADSSSSAKSLPIGQATEMIRTDNSFTGNVTHVAMILLPAKSSSNLQGGMSVSYDSGNYILGLVGDSQRGSYYIREVKMPDGTTISGGAIGNFNNVYGFSELRAADRQSLTNEIISTDRKCKFYDNEPYRGMPAIIPFDYKNGWYAATKQTLPVFGGIGAFDASGRVTSFWLCNVGENNVIDFESGMGDDLCQQVNLNTGQSLGTFPGLSENEASARINQAQQAIQEAANQYGNSYITVNGERCEVGKPSVGISETQCQDFMSPTDCHILFNVCDPVICPSSRCDFGGTYRVADVVQTGIVGSVLLCLPNIKEGIFIPVCLTGIKAGIDGWISIMRSYRDCLQENLDTGQLVGICDQVHSIYICEFFWEQVAPFIDVLLPKMIEMAYGQGTRGGAEYLTVNAAWQNMEKSVNYFTNQYAVNSMNAFAARSGSTGVGSASISGLGSEFCKSWVSTKAPNTFESLIEPDSPPQFHAWFDEKTFTTATVPATSQYKVFYHIYAGNDVGSQFSVYLRSPPSSSYYSTAQTVAVASGFVAVGEYATETRDFIAPQGYKELCVRINAEEKCGFGQVTTSFAVNYLTDEYIKSELTNSDITSESECISGSANVGALLTPNLQAGVEEVVSPSIYNRGVVRICATENPGKGTNPSRYVNVGYCENERVSCWLDKTSVNNALTSANIGARNETLTELGVITQEYLAGQGEIYTETNASEKLKEFTQRMNSLSGDGLIVDGESLLTEMNSVLDMFFFNYQRAMFYLVRGQVNEKIALAYKESKGVIREGVPTVNVAVSSSEEVTSEAKDSTGTCVLKNATWNTNTSSVGSEVKMTVFTTGNCFDTVLDISVYEDDLILDDFVLSFVETLKEEGEYVGRFNLSSTVVSDVSDGWLDDALEFYFVASLLEGSEVKSGILNVVKSDDAENTPKVVSEEPVYQTFETMSLNNAKELRLNGESLGIYFSNSGFIYLNLISNESKVGSWSLKTGIIIIPETGDNIHLGTINRRYYYLNSGEIRKQPDADAGF